MPAAPRHLVALRHATGAPGTRPALPTLPAICVARPGRLVIDLDRLGELDLGGCAVLIRTDWVDDGATPAPWLSPATAKALVTAGVRLVGIDGPQVDDPDDGPTVATALDRAGVDVLVGLAGLDRLPRYDFRVDVGDDGAVSASLRAPGEPLAPGA